MGYLRLRQICLTAPKLAPAEALITDVLGLEVCHRDGAVGKYGLENALWPVNDRFIEVVAPIREDTAAGRFMDRNPGGAGYMLIFDCDNPEERVEWASAAGVRVAHHLEHATFRGNQLHPKDCRACFLEFDHTDGGEALDGAYWPAGPDWQKHRRTDVVRALTGVEISTPDPADLARHWGAVMHETPVSDGADQVIEIDGQTLRFTERRADGREWLSAMAFDVADAAAMLERARLYGLETEADGFRLSGMWMRLG
jgi:catechol 2,3-dioxygenase-like lactoylglutathione lyase family enzyme